MLRVLIDRDPHRTPVTVTGWRVIALPERIYPGLIYDQAATATGHLFEDLTPVEWVTLDAFEADFYTVGRITLDQDRHAWAYVCADPAELLPAATWSPDDFARAHLPAYVERCTAWRRRHEATT